MEVKIDEVREQVLDAEPLDARVIANFVLDFADQRGRSVTSLSLQKLLYFCHVWTLLELRRPLIKHEFEAWEFGPVLQYVYREFKHAGDQPITTRAKRFVPRTGEMAEVTGRLSAEVEDHLKKVLEFYTQLSSSQLVNLSHVPGGPWHRVWNHVGTTNPGMRIKNNSILEFYARGFPELGRH